MVGLERQALARLVQVIEGDGLLGGLQRAARVAACEPAGADAPEEVQERRVQPVDVALCPGVVAAGERLSAPEGEPRFDLSRRREPARPTVARRLGPTHAGIASEGQRPVCGMENPTAAKPRARAPRAAPGSGASRWSVSESRLPDTAAGRSGSRPRCASRRPRPRSAGAGRSHRRSGRLGRAAGRHARSVPG